VGEPVTNAGNSRQPLRLYSELATWWPLLSPPSHYDEEIPDILAALNDAADAPPRTVLELGSGGGSVAWHLRQHFALTLSDVSAAMAAICRATNPECECVVGDMRTLALERLFDAVLVHDAITYLQTEEDLLAAFRTAAAHCRPGGGFVIVPDHVREDFAPATEHGGEDGEDGRGLRYLQWTYDPDPSDTTYVARFAFLLRERDGRVHLSEDEHQLGLFPSATWLKLLDRAGFDGTIRRDRFGRHVFVARRRVDATSMATPADLQRSGPGAR
jgi:SAM-dependent methyltransferase